MKYNFKMPTVWANYPFSKGKITIFGGICMIR